MSSSWRVGIPVIGSKGWLGGVSYVENLIKSLQLLPQRDRPELYLVVHDGNVQDFSLHEPFAGLCAGVVYIGSEIELARQLVRAPLIHFKRLGAFLDWIDFVFPNNSGPLNNAVVPESRYFADPKLCMWIPDFQHRYMPDFFSTDDRANRDKAFGMIAQHAPLVVLSSSDSEKAFRSLYPESSAATRVLHFHSRMTSEIYRGDPLAVQAKYGLPDSFLICSNQFWIHKNHPRLFEALSALRRAGLDLHLVCTGSTTDYRAERYFAEVQNFIRQMQIEDLVHILGCIPRGDQLQLMRRSLAVVQPSLFEGWSTVVEDGRSLGKCMVLSDLPVHQEQDPPGASYFQRQDSKSLAECILNVLPGLKPGPDLAAEERARVHVEGRLLDYATKFLEILRQTVSAARKPVVPVRPQDSDQMVIPAPASGRIAIATSIAPRNIELQQIAIASWLKHGFRVVSLNIEPEIEQLRQHFPQVEFVCAHRDSSAETGRPLVYIDDMLAQLKKLGTPICGIANSDIIFRAGPDFHHFIKAQAREALVFGSRINVPSVSGVLEGNRYSGGFDYFFFPSAYIELYPASNFSIGMPWWDYWMPIAMIMREKPAKRLRSPVAHHQEHPAAYSEELWMRLGAEFLRQAFAEVYASISPGHESRYDRSSEMFLLLGACARQVARILNEAHQEISYQASGATLVRSPSVTDTPQVSVLLSVSEDSEAVQRKIANLKEQSLYQRGQLEIIITGSEERRLDSARLLKDCNNLVYIEAPVQETRSGAWNRGISVARGKYLSPQFVDEAMHPLALERLSGLLENDPEAVLVHARQTLCEPGEYLRNPDGCVPAWEWQRFSRLGLLYSPQMGSQPMWRRSLHQTYGMLDESFYNRALQDFYIRISPAGKFMFIPDVLGTVGSELQSRAGSSSIYKDEGDTLFHRYTRRSKLPQVMGIPAHVPVGVEETHALANDYVLCMLADIMEANTLAPMMISLVTLLRETIEDTETICRPILERNLARLCMLSDVSFWQKELRKSYGDHFDGFFKQVMAKPAFEAIVPPALKEYLEGKIPVISISAIK